MDFEQFSNVEKEFDLFDEQQSWLAVYHRLRNQASVMHNVSVTVARRPENRSLNRYRDVSPYDHSRVLLIKGSNDYINASHVQVPDVDRKYILTQGPLDKTCGHFWQMVFEQQSEAVLMLNRVIESGRWKCAQYFPAGERVGHFDELSFEDVQIKVRLRSERNLSYFVIRELELTCLETGATRVIKHFHYLAWPDFGVPQSPAAFLSFLMAVRSAKVLDPDKGPAVVHCSAGIGRSGTFCVVDACLLLVEQQRSLAELDLQGLVLQMRGSRMGLIQTPQQLRFSYQAVLEAAHKLLSSAEDTPLESLNFVPDEPALKSTLNEEESSGGSVEDINISSDDDIAVSAPVAVSDSDSSDLEVPPPVPIRDYPAVAKAQGDQPEAAEVIADIMKPGRQVSSDGDEPIVRQVGVCELHQVHETTLDDVLESSRDANTYRKTPLEVNDVQEVLFSDDVRKAPLGGADEASVGSSNVKEVSFDANDVQEASVDINDVQPEVSVAALDTRRLQGVEHVISSIQPAAEESASDQQGLSNNQKSSRGLSDRAASAHETAANLPLYSTAASDKEAAGANLPGRSETLRVTDPVKSRDTANENGPQFGLRRRPRAEIKQRTQQQIERMKERQKQSEVWRDRRRRYARPLLIGLAAATTGALLLYMFY